MRFVTGSRISFVTGNGNGSTLEPPAPTIGAPRLLLVRPSAGRCPWGCSAVPVIMAPRISLLDGFAVHLGDRAGRRAVEHLPRGVQSLVAHMCLSGRPARATVVGSCRPM